MGLFDKLIKEGSDLFKDLTSDENKEKASSFFNSLKETLEEHKDDLKDAVQSMKEEAEKEGVAGHTGYVIPSGNAASQAPASLWEEVEDGLTCRERILKTLAEEFPAYAVKENVSPATVGGTGRFMNWSIVVYEGDAPKLVMMLIGKTTKAHREYRWSREAAESRGIAFINFVEHFPNRPEYISERLHKYL